MKPTAKLNYVMVLVGLLFCVSCSPQRGLRYDAEQDLVQLRSWMDNRLDDVDQATAEERQVIRQEFDQLNARVERNVDRLSDEARQEYNQLTARFDEWETKADQRVEQATQEDQERKAQRPRDTEVAMDPQQKEEWNDKLLGDSFKDVDKLTGEQLKDAYQVFIQNVRDQQENWGEQEWAYAESVLEGLNNRREKVDVSAGDWTRIQAWIAEFTVLQTADRIGNRQEDPSQEDPSK
jgi:hypothetical protein